MSIFCRFLFGNFRGYEVKEIDTKKGKEFTKKIGNALINKGVVILAGSAIAGK